MDRPPNALAATGPISRRRALRWSAVDGALHAVMLGTSETYLGALAVELGHRDVALALLVTVPLLCGALAQLATPRLVRLAGSERRFIVACAALQGLAHLGFLAIVLSGSSSLPALLATKILYWVSGAVIGPAWNAWMARLVPAKLRGPYFARRNMITHAVLLFAFLGSGLWLEAERQRIGSALAGFAVLYGVALVARLASAFALSRQAPFRAAGPTKPRPALRTILAAGRWRVALYCGALLFGAQLAVPFFTPYMLRELGLDFTSYALLSSVAIFAKAVAFRAWRRARLEPLSMLAVAGLGIAAVPLAWAASPNLAVLVVAQLIGGWAWAGYELASLELLLGDAPEDGPVEFFALVGSLVGTTQLVGSMLGGWALRSDFDYADVFLLSALGRAIALLFLLPLLPVRASLRRVRVAVRFIGVRPSSGAVPSTPLPAGEADDEG